MAGVAGVAGRARSARNAGVAGLAEVAGVEGVAVARMASEMNDASLLCPADSTGADEIAVFADVAGDAVSQPWTASSNIPRKTYRRA